MTATLETVPAPADLPALRRRLRQAEEVEADLGRRLFRLDLCPFGADPGEQAALEAEMDAARREVASLRAAVARGLAAGGDDCRECGGHGYVLIPALSAEACPECGSVSVPLPATRTHKKGRAVKYVPAVRRLTIGSGRKAVTYAVAEFTPDRDWEGRAWTLTRADGADVYHVLVSRHGTSCDCAGAAYEAVARGNERAYWAGDDVYGTDCCKHATALRLLLKAGLLDPAPVPAASSEPASDPFA